MAEDSGLVNDLRKRLLRLSQAMRREAEGLSITTTQGAVLSLLRAEPRTIGDLAKAEGVRPPSMTQIINRMVDAGWLVRPDGLGKGRTVEMTDAGRAVAEQVRQQRNEQLAQRLANLSQEELATLQAVLPVLDRLFGPPVPE